MHQHLVVALRHAHGGEDGTGRVRAHQEVDLVGGDELLVQGAREIGLGLVVLDDPFHLPAEQAAALVELLHIDLADHLVHERGLRQRPGERERAADADRRLVLCVRRRCGEERDGEQPRDASCERHGSSSLVLS